MSILENNFPSVDRISDIVLGESIINEVMNRERNSFNLILYNIQEADGRPSDESPTPTDSDLVKSVLQSIEPSEYSNLKAVKLGKKIQGRTRPVRVTLPLKTDVTTILRNKFKYSGPVKIQQDRTVKQREHLAKVRSELKSLIDSGVTDKTIRYINGVPIITDVKPSLKKKN